MTGSQTTLEDLLVDTGLDAWVDELTPPGLPDDFALILQNPQGANLDVATINLLSASGVYNVKPFLQFTQEPFSDMLCTFSDSQFSSLSADKLCNTQLYGHYLVEQQLIQDNSTINIATFDWHTYYTYWRHNHHQVGISFNAAYHLEAETCCHETLAQPIHHSPPSVVTTLMAHDTGIDPTVTPTPDQCGPVPLLPPPDDDDITSDATDMFFAPAPCSCPSPRPVSSRIHIQSEYLNRYNLSSFYITGLYIKLA